MIATGKPSYVPTIPPRPALESTADPVLCRIADGRQRECVLLLSEDLAALVRWGLTLERELRAACLTLAPSLTCGAEALKME